MEKLATKPGLKFKLRSDIWDGPFRVIGKLPNGNLKIDIGDGKRKVYIVHPDRLNLAESDFIERPTKRKKTLKKVSFKEEVSFI